MKTRKMICAGRFYPSGRQCGSELEEMFANAALRPAAEKVVAGIVPHAGWVFSGQVAADVFEAIAKSYPDVATFVLFGASHSYMVEKATVYENGGWETPLGDVEVNAALAEILLKNTERLVADKFLHNCEHSIEVNVPFIKFRFPQASIVPILMPPIPSIIETARRIGEVLASQGGKVVCIGSSDLTHYGNDYGFTPAGLGAKGCKWAKEVNDKSLISSILEMDCGKVLEKGVNDCSACGPGAIAATIAAAKELGASKARLLSHIDSSEIMRGKFARRSESSVGYAGVVFV